MGVPGSGKYDPSVNYVKENGRQFSVPKQRRDGEVNIFKQTPGVGTYKPDSGTLMTRHKSATWRVGSEKRPKHQ